MSGARGREPDHPAGIIDPVCADRVVIQDFRPVSECLDWELGQLYYLERGSAAFWDLEVPNWINNDGMQADHAARLLHATLTAGGRGMAGQEKIYVLEIGVGSGLFARHFLDAFSGICERAGHGELANRVCYVAADHSARMVGDLRRLGLLDQHAGRVRSVKLEGSLTAGSWAERLGEPGFTGFHAVILNYLLDCLPASVLMVEPDGVRHLSARTSLARGIVLEDHCPWSQADLIKLANSPDPADRAKLIDLYLLFRLDYRFDPVAPGRYPHLDCAMRLAGTSGSFVLHNYGALELLDSLQRSLVPGGWILINDYGYDQPQERPEAYLWQHFSGSTAIPVNFRLLEEHCRHCTLADWIQPPDDHPDIFSRLVGRELHPEVAASFGDHFSGTRRRRLVEPVERAREFIKGGRTELALLAFREALELQPSNWITIREAARFVAYSIQDHRAGQALAESGLALNPLSADLWNTRGDCLFQQNLHAKAHESFLKALEVHPNDIRARYNLVYTYAQQRDFEAALRMTAEGLAKDQTGDYRERFLQRQSEILSRLEQLRRQRTHFFANRSTPISISLGFDD